MRLDFVCVACIHPTPIAQSGMHPAGIATCCQYFARTVLRGMTLPGPEGTKTHLLKLAVGTALLTSLRTSRAPADRFESHARQLCASPILAPPYLKM